MRPLDDKSLRRSVPWMKPPHRSLGVHNSPVVYMNQLPIKGSTIHSMYAFSPTFLCPQYRLPLKREVDDLQPMWHWFESPLEQFRLKIKAGKSDPGNGEMTQKIPLWLEKSGCGKGKTSWKNSGMVRNFRVRKRLPVHGTFSTLAFVV